MPVPPRRLRPYRPTHDAIESRNLVSSLIPALPSVAQAGPTESQIAGFDGSTARERDSPALVAISAGRGQVAASIPTLRVASPRTVTIPGPKTAPTPILAPSPTGVLLVSSLPASQGPVVATSIPPLPDAPVVVDAAPAASRVAPTPAPAPRVADQAAVVAPMAVTSTSQVSGVATTAGIVSSAKSSPKAPATLTKKDLEDYRVGNPDVDRTGTTPGLALVGGGTDVDEAFRWMSTKSQGGDFVVIRASGTDAYNPYLLNEIGATFNSVETLIIKSRAAANDPSVVAKIRNAEGVFIAGGDQSDYVDFWKGTALETAINDVSARIPVGGTSAGLAVLSQYVYTGENGSVTSDQALSNPYNRRVTLDQDFLDPAWTDADGNLGVIHPLDNVITDSHFVTRDRMGRLDAFLARLVQDGSSSQPRGLGINEQTAVLVEPSGQAHVVANPGALDPYAYFLQASGSEPEVCEPKSPLTFSDISVYRIDAKTGGSFDLLAWAGTGGLGYTLSVDAGMVISDAPDGSIYG